MDVASAQKIQQTTPAPLWQRRPVETPQAWRAFKAFIDLPNEQRTISELARQMNLSETLLRGWASRHSWRLRASAFDMHLDELSEVRSTKSKLEAANRHAEAAQSLVRVAAHSARKLKKVDAKLLPSFLRAGVELERLARGESNSAATAAPIQLGIGLSFGDRRPAWFGSTSEAKLLEAKPQTEIEQSTNTITSEGTRVRGSAAPVRAKYQSRNLNEIVPKAAPAAKSRRLLAKVEQRKRQAANKPGDRKVQ